MKEKNQPVKLMSINIKSKNSILIIGLVLLTAMLPGIVSALSPPAAQFVANTTGGRSPLTVQFTDKSVSAGTTSYKWDINNDGVVDYTTRNPVRTFVAPGTYTVKLTVTNASGSDTEVKTSYVKVSPALPAAQFVANTTLGRSPLTVQFTDKSVSTGTTSYKWDINNDGVVDYTTRNPVRTFVAPGTYTVKLTVTNAYGSDTEVKTSYVKVSPALPAAQFVANTTLGLAPLTVQLTDKSVSAGTTSYKWDINNDGVVDYTTRNPVRTFVAPGTYTVKLTVTNASGSDTEVKTSYVKVSSSAIEPGSCLAAPIKAQLDTSWDRKKGEMKNTFISGLAGGNPVELYNIQAYTNNLLDETAKCQDYTTLNELVGIYNSSYRYLSVTPEGREWLCGDQCKTGSGDADLDPSYKGKEVELYSQQFMFLVSRTLNIIASMDEQDKTPEMKAFTKNFGPLAVESYMRWQPVYLQKVQRKLTVSLSEAGKYDAIYDHELWMDAGIVELLAANSKDSTIKISDQQRVALLEYVRTMNRLVQSRVTQTSLKNFAGTTVKGVIIDYGVAATPEDNLYSCYYGTTFPTSAQQCTTKTGWDINHGKRFVQVFETLYHNRQITGDSFPDEAFMKSLANELVYGSSNRDVEKPLFTNYFGGVNGWYRVGFHDATFGYPPYGLTSYVPEGGYGYWAEYNSDIGMLMHSLLDRTANITKPSGNFQDPFMLKYYPALQWDYGKIRFLPTFATN